MKVKDLYQVCGTTMLLTTEDGIPLGLLNDHKKTTDEPVYSLYKDKEVVFMDINGDGILEVTLAYESDDFRI